ncbi:hypothetical protein [Burkholderia phage BCSR5]|nr:hypothetical protein [Burkholderia phage BCSR5]
MALKRRYVVEVEWPDHITEEDEHRLTTYVEDAITDYALETGSSLFSDENGYQAPVVNSVGIMYP